MGKLGSPGCPPSNPTIAQEKIRHVVFFKVARVSMPDLHVGVSELSIADYGSVCS